MGSFAPVVHASGTPANSVSITRPRSDMNTSLNANDSLRANVFRLHGEPPDLPFRDFWITSHKSIGSIGGRVF